MNDEQLTTLMSDLSGLGIETPMELAQQKLKYWEKSIIVGGAESALMVCPNMVLQMQLTEKVFRKTHKFVITLNTMNHKVLDVSYKYSRTYQHITDYEIQEIQDIIDDIFEQTDDVIKPGYSVMFSDPIRCYLKNLYFRLLHRIQTQATMSRYY